MSLDQLYKIREQVSPPLWKTHERVNLTTPTHYIRPLLTGMGCREKQWDSLQQQVPARAHWSLHGKKCLGSMARGMVESRGSVRRESYWFGDHSAWKHRIVPTSNSVELRHTHFKVRQRTESQQWAKHPSRAKQTPLWKHHSVVLWGIQDLLGKCSQTKEWFWKVATAFCTKETTPCTKETPWNTVHGIYLPGHRSELKHTDDIYTGSDCPLKVSPPVECPPRVQAPQQAVFEHEP